MKLNTHKLVERAVWEGTVVGMNTVSQTPDIKSNTVADVISKSVMDELEEVIQFDKQELEVSDTLLYLIMNSDKLKETEKGTNEKRTE